MVWLIALHCRSMSNSSRFTVRNLSLATFKHYPLQRVAVPLALLFLVCVGGAVWQRYLPQPVLAFYLGLSVFTFVVYAVDKAAAKNGTWRVPEGKLHLLAAVGGWPGALCGQQWLRHKSSKQPFRSLLWFTVLLNGLAFTGLFTQTGAAMLSSLIKAVG